MAVVVNSFNLADYLPQALRSALGQQDPPDELIVVDDGSTDGTRELLREWGDRAHVVLQPNAGQAAALNTGFATARSDVLVFLDADDVLLPHAVSVVRQAWRPGVAKLHWPMRVVDGSGAHNGRVVPPSPLPEGDLSELLLTEGPSAVVLTSPPTSGNAWSREALRPVMPMDEVHWRSWPDTYLLTVAALVGPVVALAAPLSDYRVHGDNASLAGGDVGRMQRARSYVRDSGELLRALRPERVAPDDVERWVRLSWPARALALHALIEQEVPPGGTVLLHDDWLTGWTEVAGRRVVRSWEDEAAAASYVALPWWQPDATSAPGAHNDGGVVAPA